MVFYRSRCRFYERFVLDLTNIEADFNNSLATTIQPLVVRSVLDNEPQTAIDCIIYEDTAGELFAGYIHMPPIEIEDTSKYFQEQLIPSSILTEQGWQIALGVANVAVGEIENKFYWHDTHTEEEIFCCINEKELDLSGLGTAPLYLPKDGNTRPFLSLKY